MRELEGFGAARATRALVPHFRARRLAGAGRGAEHCKPRGLERMERE
jgi:hypothetical protein